LTNASEETKPYIHKIGGIWAKGGFGECQWEEKGGAEGGGNGKRERRIQTRLSGFRKKGSLSLKRNGGGLDDIGKENSHGKKVRAGKQLGKIEL